MHESITFFFPELPISLVSSLFYPFSARDPYHHFKNGNSDLSKKAGIKMRFLVGVDFFPYPKHSVKCFFSRRLLVNAEERKISCISSYSPRLSEEKKNTTIAR